MELQGQSLDQDEQGQPVDEKDPTEAEEQESEGHEVEEQEKEPEEEQGPMLTEKEVTSVMESDSVKEAFYECAAVSAHPENLILSFIVDEKGQATLFSTEPEVNKELLSCLRAVSRVVEFEPKGKKFEITYPMKLPPHFEIKPKKKSTPLRAAGWVMFGLGAAVMAAGGACGGWALYLDKNLKDRCPDHECGPGEQDEVERMNALALSSDVLLGAGGAMTLSAIIMLAVSSRPEKKNRDVSMLPLPLFPAGLRLTWKF